MEPQEFISSGIIESYVLGIASEKEAKLVREMMKVYPAIEHEMDSVEESLLNIAKKNTGRPNQHIKTQLLDYINRHT